MIAVLGSLACLDLVGCKSLPDICSLQKMRRLRGAQCPDRITDHRIVLVSVFIIMAGSSNKLEKKPPNEEAQSR